MVAELSCKLWDTVQSLPNHAIFIFFWVRPLLSQEPNLNSTPTHPRKPALRYAHYVKAIASQLQGHNQSFGHLIIKRFSLLRCIQTEDFAKSKGLARFQGIYWNKLPLFGHAYLVHYTILFHSRGGYFNSLVLQALELLPGRAKDVPIRYDFALLFHEQKEQKKLIKYSPVIGYLLVNPLGSVESRMSFKNPLANL